MIDHVQFLSDLVYNLLGVEQLITREHSIIFDNNKCIITNKKSGYKVQIFINSNKMFPLDVYNIENFSLAASTKDDSTLWASSYEGPESTQGQKHGFQITKNWFN